MYIYTFRYWKLRSELQCWLDVKENLFLFRWVVTSLKTKHHVMVCWFKELVQYCTKIQHLHSCGKKKHTGEHKGKHHILIIAWLSLTLCTYYTRKWNKTLNRYTMPNTQKWIYILIIWNIKDTTSLKSIIILQNLEYSIIQIFYY